MATAIEPGGEPRADSTAIRFAVITMSDSGASGNRRDTSGEALIEVMKERDCQLCHYVVVPDSIPRIVEAVRTAIERFKADLIITTGGTGVSPTDVTPEAMDLLIERELPGFAEAMRAASLKITPHAVLSRSRAGIRGQSLIINLPGSRKAALENLAAVVEAVPHAVEKIKGSDRDCAV